MPILQATLELGQDREKDNKQCQGEARQEPRHPPPGARRHGKRKNNHNTDHDPELSHKQSLNVCRGLKEALYFGARIRAFLGLLSWCSRFLIGMGRELGIHECVNGSGRLGRPLRTAPKNPRTPAVNVAWECRDQNSVRG